MSDMANWQVILVDDEPDSLNLISEMLAHGGAEVHRASSGAECLEMLQHLTPTLIVVDLAMPKPDGWDLLAHIRANPIVAAVPVVAITAYHSANVARQAQDMGFDAYVPKPIKSQQFMDTLRNTIS